MLVTARASLALALAALLSGCAGTRGTLDEPTAEREPACGHSAAFAMPGLYGALANASAGSFVHEQWAGPGLPYENATLRALWHNYSPFYVTRHIGIVHDLPTSLSVRARGDQLEIFGNGEANVTAEEMRGHFLDFAAHVAAETNETKRSAWADAFAASRSASAIREGIPGNATPGGKGPFREYQDGPVYGYSYDVTIDATPRIQQLLDAFPPLDRWERNATSEESRMVYERDGWTLWFEQPVNRLEVGDVRIAAIPTGAAWATVGVPGQNESEALRTLLGAFHRAELTAPTLAARDMARMWCGH